MICINTAYGQFEKKSYFLHVFVIFFEKIIDLKIGCLIYIECDQQETLDVVSIDFYIFQNETDTMIFRQSR